MTRLVRIADVATIVRGVTYNRDAARSTPAEDYIPILRAGNIQEQLSVDTDLVWVPRAFVSDLQILRPDDLVMCTSSGSADVIGKTAVFQRADWMGSFGAFCAVVRPDNTKCLPSFLKHVLKSRAFLGWARSSLGANIKNIRKSELEQFQFHLPSIVDQRRVAAILDNAISLRRKRQEAKRLVNEFLRAAFYDRCGDPVANTMSWPEKPICEIGKVTTGNTPSREVGAYFGDAIEWIKSDNINTPSHLLTKASEGLSELGASLGRIVPAGSTLVTCIAGSAHVIGNVAQADRRVAFNQQINAITPVPSIDPDFLYTLILFSKPRIQAASTNSMKGMVSKGAIEKVRVIWPTADAQREIATLFRKVKQLLGRMEDADPAPLVEALQHKLLA